MADVIPHEDLIAAIDEQLLNINRSEMGDELALAAIARCYQLVTIAAHGHLHAAFEFDRNAEPKEVRAQLRAVLGFTEKALMTPGEDARALDAPDRSNPISYAASVLRTDLALLDRGKKVPHLQREKDRHSGLNEVELLRKVTAWQIAYQLKDLCAGWDDWGFHLAQAGTTQNAMSKRRKDYPIEIFGQGLQPPRIESKDDAIEKLKEIFEDEKH